jgi:1,4-alpha-glucan branching enzyme
LHAADENWDGFTWLNVEDRQNSVFAFIRILRDEDATVAEAAGAEVTASSEGACCNLQGNTAGDQVVCVFNFTPVTHDAYDIALPKAGNLNLILNSDDPRYGGAGAMVKRRVNASGKRLNSFEYSATLTLPPMSALYYSFRGVF